jgi:signal transduction histidine kinase/ligand-binding sensor domain-containing protein
MERGTRADLSFPFRGKRKVRMLSPLSPRSIPPHGPKDEMKRWSMYFAGANVSTGWLRMALLSCSFICVASISPAFAQYHFDVWTTDNGLPQNSISSIAQSGDGYLWFATFGGLVRYDGVRFTVFGVGDIPGLTTSRFSRVFADASGDLWITAELGGLFRYKDGEFLSYSIKDGLPDNRVSNVRQDEGGYIRLETPKGLVWWKDGKFVSSIPLSTPYSGFGLPGRPGAAWYFAGSALHRVENGKVTAELPLPGLTFYDIKSLYEARNGELWIGTGNGVLLRHTADGLRRYGIEDHIPEKRVNRITEDLQGNIWIGFATAGIMRFKNDKFDRYTKADGLAGDDALSLYNDREGTIWVGTTTGLSRLGDRIITSYSTDNGLAANNTYPICQARDGTIWIGGFSGLTTYSDGGFARSALADGWVTALMQDRDDGLWIGTWGGGAKRFKDGKLKSSLQKKDGLPDDVVRAIVEDRAGTFWFGCYSGLAIYRGGTITVRTTKDGLPGNQVVSLFEDSKGVIWVGTEFGLCSFQGDAVTSYANEPSLASHMVRAFYEDSDGVLWIGTYDAGLVRLKEGNFTSYTTREGLFNNGVFQILEDAGRDFWISCNQGIYRVRKQELNDYAEGRVKSIASIPYGKRDGMLNSECNGGAQPAGIKSGDGRLWFPTQGGVAIVDPNAVPVSPALPPVTVEQVLVGNQPVVFRGLVKIPPGNDNFEIHYTALSFIMSDRIAFKYMLEGLDRDWVDAGNRRVAYYSHVPSGSYTFRVIAANRDGVWNLEGAAVLIRISPPFYRTWWFVTLASAVAGAIVLLGYRVRVNQLEKERQAQEVFSQQLINSQESERKRIAAELHDGLGQHLLIIKNSALLGLIGLDQQDRGKDQLDDISITASRAIDEVREIAYNLRPYQLDDLGLTKALEAIISKAAASSTIEFSWDIDGIDRLFTPQAEINIYRILQESLNNILKHSEATRVRIVVRRAPGNVDIAIHDNGRGFDLGKSIARTQASGFGLKGLSERARMLGARYNIQSAPGHGTTVSLILETPNGLGK